VTLADHSVPSQSPSARFTETKEVGQRGVALEQQMSSLRMLRTSNI
jgi:hypothetical protein